MKIDTTELVEALEGLLDARRMEDLANRAEESSGDRDYPFKDPELVKSAEGARGATQEAWDRFDRALAETIDERVRAIVAEKPRSA